MLTILIRKCLHGKKPPEVKSKVSTSFVNSISDYCNIIDLFIVHQVFTLSAFTPPPPLRGRIQEGSSGSQDLPVFLDPQS